MPPHRHKHRKDIKYWLLKLFPFLNRKRYKRYRRQEEEPINVRFLTMEEVKSSGSVLPANPDENKFLDDSGNMYSEQPLFPRHSPHNRSRHRKNSSGWMRKLFRGFFFIGFKRKRSRITREEYNYLSMEDIWKAKEQNDTTNSSWHPESPAAPSFLNEEEGFQEGGAHKGRKRRRKGIFRIFRKRRKRKPAVNFTPDEIKLPDREKVPLKHYLRPILNSTAIFMISYQLCWLFYQIVVMLVASLSKIDSVLFYYEVLFPIGNHSPKWNQTNIIAITLAGPLISLTIASIIRFVLLRRFHPGAQMRQFLVWMYLNSMMLFLGAFVGGAVTRQGFGYVVDWLFMNVAFRIMLSMIFLSLIIWISWKVVSFLPETSGQDSWKSNRTGYVLSRLVIPWFIGGIIMVLLKITPVIPQHENIFNYDAINIATLAFAVIPPLFNAKNRPHLIQNKKTYIRTHRITIAVWLLIAIAFVLLVRFGLENGLYFKFEVSLDMGRYYL